MYNSTVSSILLGIVLAAGAVPAVVGAQQIDAAANTIRVLGAAEIEVAPDVADIALAVETFAETARAAGEENARTMERVIRALVAAGVARDDIETRNYSVYPEYVMRDNEREEPRIRGYRATNQVVVETTRLDAVGGLIDTALQAGANRVDGVEFGLRDEATARAAALRQAVENARAAAETMAAALGVRLGAIVHASTEAVPTRPVPMPVMMRQAASDMAGAAPTPIRPAEQRIMAQATVVWAIVQTIR